MINNTIAIINLVNNAISAIATLQVEITAISLYLIWILKRKDSKINSIQ